jgi:LuxR family maltose regulon positive regulatory protein
LSQSGTRVAWLSLDRSDARAGAFEVHLQAAIGSLAEEHLQPGVDRPLEARRSLAETVDRLAACDNRLVLIIDDLHHADATRSDSCLSTVLGLAPPNMTLVAASRAVMPFAAAKLRAREEICEYWARDLLFTDEEAARYLRQVPPSCQALVTAARGWPAVLGLVRSAVRAPIEGKAWRDGQSDHRALEVVDDYLAGTILQTLPLDLRNTLTYCAILEKFDQSLAEAVTQAPVRNADLRCLERDALIETADPDGWYVVHSLLRASLQRYLADFDRKGLSKAHRRAAVWYRDQGLYRQAVDHAIEAKDSQLAARILDAAGGWRVGLQGGEQALRKMATFESESDASNPHIALGRIYALIKDERTHHARMALDRILANLPQPETALTFADPRDARLVIDSHVLNAVLSIYEERQIPESSSALLSGIIESNPALGKEDTAQVQIVRCYTAFQAGHWRETIFHGSDALLALDQSHADYGALFVRLYVGMARRALGDFAGAWSAFEDVRCRADASFGDKSAGAMFACAFLAELHTELADYDAAHDCLARCDRQVIAHERWTEALAALHLATARLTQKQSSSVAACAYLDEQRELAARRDNARLSAILFCERLTMDGGGHLPEAGLTSLPDIAGTYPMSLAPWHDIELAMGLADLIGHGRWPNLPMVGNSSRTGSDAIAVKCQLVKCASLSSRREMTAAIGCLRTLLVQLNDLQWPVRILTALAKDLREPFEQLCRDADRGVADAAWSGARYLNGSAMLSGKLPKLSARQQQILELLQRGYSTKEMANALHISEGTAKVHRKNLYDRLSVHSRSEAIAVMRVVGAAPIGRHNSPPQTH